MHELCCVGHITLDKVVTPQRTVRMPGGTAFYFSHAIKGFSDIGYTLATAVGAPEMPVVEALRAEGIEARTMPSAHSVCFENIYGEDPNKRSQRVLAKADPFTLAFVQGIAADVYHLGSLLADDFPPEIAAGLDRAGARVSIDVQGYLREVCGTQVRPVDWTEKLQTLRHAYYLKANEQEMQVLTGTDDVAEAARILHGWGVRESILTLGSLGSVIYDGETFHRIPAFRPREVVDTTGCGDTYMAGYLYRRCKGDSIEAAGRFAAAMCTLKIGQMGPFQGDPESIRRCMEEAETVYPALG